MLPTKKILLLSRDELMNSASVGHVWFAPETVEVDRLVMKREMWNEMGSPAEITMTIEPGDRLN